MYLETRKTIQNLQVMEVNMSRYYIGNLPVSESTFESEVLLNNEWEIDCVKTNAIGLKNYYYYNIENGKTALEVEGL